MAGPTASNTIWILRQYLCYNVRENLLTRKISEVANAFADQEIARHHSGCALIVMMHGIHHVFPALSIPPTNLACMMRQEKPLE